MRSILKGCALVVAGILVSIAFQFTVNFQYTCVHQSVGDDSGIQRQVTLSLQPYHQSPVINLFGGDK